MLYGVGCYRREIFIYKNFSQTWYLFCFFFLKKFIILTWTHSTPIVTFGGSLLFLLFGVIYLYESAIAISPDIDMSIPMSPEAPPIL